MRAPPSPQAPAFSPRRGFRTVNHPPATPPARLTGPTPLATPAPVNTPSLQDFAATGLDPRLLPALARAGFHRPTPIQAGTIPVLLSGRDLLALARTGSGKTVAVLLPLLHRLLASPPPESRQVSALVLAPTRELAAQLRDVVRTLSEGLPLRSVLLIGGVPKPPQARSLLRGVHLAVATPGRLLDHLQDRAVALSATAALVLDEADRMLDLGFAEPIRAIADQLPPERQTVLLSATMPPTIVALSATLLRDPVRIGEELRPAAPGRLDQRVVFAEAREKPAVLATMLKGGRMTRTMVFCRTRAEVDALVAFLDAKGLRAGTLHGDRSQAQRDRALAAFRDGTVPILVATDVAARGLDVPALSHVVNLDIPGEPDTYLHRIGRTARAGADGIAVSLCAASERTALRAIEKHLKRRIRVHEARNAA
ncbi:MAG: DEAD/DEAH box helicase [Gluconacetobacter diazotrophicus]|nr:DEAD/DEAH box helicase [Gluconacetobacter diazotrophicus]